MTVFGTDIGSCVWNQFWAMGSGRWSEAHRLTRNHMHIMMRIPR
jgi:hypothetical protein